MKKIITSVLVALILLSSCGAGHGNEEQTSVPSAETENAGTSEVSDSEVYDFTATETVKKSKITSDDLILWLNDAAKIYKNYNLIKGQIINCTYSSMKRTEETRLPLSYESIECAPTKELRDKYKNSPKELLTDECRTVCQEIFQIYILLITEFCSPDIIISECNYWNFTDITTFDRGSGLSYYYPYTVLLDTENEKSDDTQWIIRSMFFNCQTAENGMPEYISLPQYSDFYLGLLKDCKDYKEH